MEPGMFERTLERAVELRRLTRARGDVDPRISLCGLGEPLLNRHAVSYVRRVREASFHCSMSSNGFLLTEERADALLDAGLQRIFLNVGERDEQYREIYRLPFERTRDNVLRFKERAGGRCEVVIVLVDHRGDPEHMKMMRAYWSEQGIEQFQQLGFVNRGGALPVEHMRFEAYPELGEAQTLLAERDIQPLCMVPFLFLFVGFDGRYYLCCSDWRKQAPLGSVFDESFGDVLSAKLAHVRTREPVCRTCSFDPQNRLTAALRERRGRGGAASVDDVVVQVAEEAARVAAVLERELGAPA
jgi:MoaA/NifB/PqqE/SkfB family radical SAM enzyme